jgi:hypothetical protein
MANTYVLISSNTVGSGGVASVTFSSIPATYTDLKLSYSMRNTAFWSSISFNGSSANFSSRWINGNGSAVNSGTRTDNTEFVLGELSTYTANTFTNGDIYIPNYASANYKSFSIDAVNENNATLAYTHLGTGLWSNGAAITSITITPSSGNILEYSTFYLYGIKNS